MNLKDSIIQRRTRFGAAVLIVLLWQWMIAILAHLLPVPYFFNFLYPFPVMEAFLLQWTDAAWVITFLLLLLSLLGWLLLHHEKPLGRLLLVGSQCLLLCADAIITPLHLMNAAGYFNWFGGRQPSTLGTVTVLGLTGAIYPVVVLILTSKWKPNIK